jgi:hypothetical protein
MAKNDGSVVRHGTDWPEKEGGADRASSTHRAQREAVAKNAVALGNDPFFPRDKRH